MITVTNNIDAEKKILQEKDTKLIIGSPGCGKTTRLLEIIEQALAEGCHINQIGFTTFSVAGVQEAVERVNKKFKFGNRNIQYFRTLHAMAFLLQNLDQKNTFGNYKKYEFAKKYNLKLSSSDSDNYYTDDDKILQIVNLARLYEQPVEEAIRKNRLAGSVDVAKAKRIAADLEAFKFHQQLFDYTDMIQMAIDNEIYVPTLKYLIVDEAQDLSRLQWRLVFKLAQQAEKIIIAGDDKQCINSFAGADLETFLNLDVPIEVLPNSYRVPKAVHLYALKCLKKIKARHDVEWNPRDEKGSVKRVYNLPMREILDSEESWLVLARNRHYLGEVTERLFQRGVPFCIDKKAPFDTDVFKAIEVFNQYKKNPSKVTKKKLQDLRKFIPYAYFEANLKMDSWTQAFSRLSQPCRKYIVSLIENGSQETDFSKARIRLSTVHQAKGTEADNVLILNQYSKAVEEELEADPEGEYRVLFVAITRARKNLYILDGATARRYEL